MSFYMGLNDENVAPLAPTAQQVADLRELGFAIVDADGTWSAVRELDGYRTSLTLARDLAMVSMVRVTGLRVLVVEDCDSLDEAIDRVMELALDVSTHLLIGDLVRADLRRAA